MGPNNLTFTAVLAIFDIFLFLNNALPSYPLLNKTESPYRMRQVKETDLRNPTFKVKMPLLCNSAVFVFCAFAFL